MTNIPRHIHSPSQIAMLQETSAFYANAAQYNLLASAGRDSQWERESFLSHAVRFQRKSAEYAALARSAMGLE